MLPSQVPRKRLTRNCQVTSSSSFLLCGRFMSAVTGRVSDFDANSNLPSGIPTPSKK